MRGEVEAAARECPAYGELCRFLGYDTDTTLNHNNLDQIPYIPTQFFKNSLNHYTRLLRVPPSRIACWHISSSTTQDPSIVGRTKRDLEQLRYNWLTAWRRFLFLERTSHTLNFAPNHFAMRIVARRSGAQIRGGRLYVDFINSIMDPYVKVTYVVRFRLLKTLGQLFRFRIRAVADLNKEAVVKAVTRRKGEEGICLGGNPLLLNRMVTHDMKGEEYPLGEYGWVGTGGGGWDGVKAQLKMDPIDKSSFVEAIERVFHIPAKNLRDNYTFTETPAAFLAHWSERLQDFVMHVPPNAMIVVRDTETLEPVGVGDEGLLEVLTPYGVEGAACVAVIVDDVVRLLGSNTSTCSECGHKGATFVIRGRLKGAPGRSCSSIVGWLEDKPKTG